MTMNLIRGPPREHGMEHSDYIYIFFPWLIWTAAELYRATVGDIRITAVAATLVGRNRSYGEEQILRRASSSTPAGLVGWYQGFIQRGVGCVEWGTPPQNLEVGIFFCDTQ